MAPLGFSSYFSTSNSLLRFRYGLCFLFFVFVIFFLFHSIRCFRRISVRFSSIQWFWSFVIGMDIWSWLFAWIRFDVEKGFDADDHCRWWIETRCALMDVWPIDAKVSKWIITSEIWVANDPSICHRQSSWPTSLEYWFCNYHISIIDICPAVMHHNRGSPKWWCIRLLESTKRRNVQHETRIALQICKAP